MLEHAVRPHVERAALSVAHAPAYDQQRVALATIRRTAPGLQRALEGAITEARGYARTAGRELLASAFAVASPLRSRAGTSTTQPQRMRRRRPGPRRGRRRRRRSSFRTTIRRAPPRRRPARARRASGASPPPRRRAPSTTSGDAHSTTSRSPRSRRSSSGCGARSSIERRAPSASARTGRSAHCTRASARRRPCTRTAAASSSWCACLAPRGSRTSRIDYASFKAEVRDVIRERREESGRHAAAFITDSMGARTRSPLVLTGRFTRKPYVAR